MITTLSFWEIVQLIIGFIIITSIVGIICFIIYEKLLSFCEKNEQMMNKFNTLSKRQIFWIKFFLEPFLLFVFLCIWFFVLHGIIDMWHPLNLAFSDSDYTKIFILPHY